MLQRHPKTSKQKSVHEKVDIIFFILLPIIAPIIALMLKFSFLFSILLFFGVPSLWLSFRSQGKIKRAFLFAAVFSIPVSIIADYLGILNKGWYVPHTIFPFRVLNGMPIDDFFWGFFGVYGCVMFYEHFFDRGKSSAGKREKKFLAIFTILLTVFFLILGFKQDLLVRSYFFFWGGLFLFILPMIFFILKNPRLLSKFIYPGIFYFVISIAFEITSLKLGHWFFFDSEFIGWVELFGQKMPFEEFIYWFVIGGPAILAYYEYFIDDNK
ncbi:hypothetical protein JW766_04285 [Candidatus Dojkabacteria bacterium]|nr:hypothetical protein [Candidatus Dojkabacteria bacterium]